MAIERAEKLIYIKTNIDADDDGYKQSDEGTVSCPRGGGVIE